MRQKAGIRRREPKLLALVLLLLAGAGAFAEEIELQPIAGGTFRYKDILGQAYGADFIADFAYTDEQVQVTLDATNRHFSGTRAATGLTPNFAYQHTLVGDPGLAGDPTNDRLGALGRWWEVAPDPGNVTDAERSAHLGDPAYVYQGYLLFGFFVTDEQGNASVSFRARSSFHVLWRTNQRAPHADDGPPLDVILPATDGNPAYDVALPERSARLYGQHEPTRPLPGELLLPAGHYRCSLVLTEESFHDSGALAGSWAAALGASVEFEVSATAPAIVSGPAATPNPTPSTTAALSALASDDGGEADLVYTWSVLAKPAGAADPALSVNGSNAAKDTVATFERAGTYQFQVSVRDLDLQSASASVEVAVAQTLEEVVVSPATATVLPGRHAQFLAAGRDQFGMAMAADPTWAWSVAGGGTVDLSGLFTAGPHGGHTCTVTAASGGRSGSASVRVRGQDHGGGGGGGCSLAAAPASTSGALGWAAPYLMVGIARLLTRRSWRGRR
jgi:hypothetical protein